MTKDFIVSRIRFAIKQSGVNGYYIFFEDGVEFSNGTIINEVRLKSKSMGVEFLEKGTNKVIRNFSKKDAEKVYSLI